MQFDRLKSMRIFHIFNWYSANIVKRKKTRRDLKNIWIYTITNQKQTCAGVE